jgi:hypothetical protein
MQGTKGKYYTAIGKQGNMKDETHAEKTSSLG